MVSKNKLNKGIVSDKCSKPNNDLHCQLLNLLKMGAELATISIVCKPTLPLPPQAWL